MRSFCCERRPEYGFGVFRVSGFGFRASELGCQVSDFEVGVKGFEFGMAVSGVRLWGECSFKLKVLRDRGLGFRVQSYRSGWG